MDDENEEKVNQSEEKKENSSNIKQKIAQKSAKKLAGKASMMGPLAHIIAIAAPILVLIIILGGIILFFLTMPGMVMEKLKALGKAIAKGMASWFGADDTEMIDDYVIYQTLDYLEEMGYDLKGYGFLTDYVGDADDGVERSDGETKVNDKTIAEGKITSAESEFVLTYLVSDNYVYTLKNKNLVTGEGFLAKLNAVGQHIKDFFGGSYGEKWTRGLIALYEEDGSIGKRGGFYSDTGFGNFDKVDIDPEAKTLILKNGQWFNSNGSMKYSLDGWTGRYGMPLEFLLSIHIATMMPDLAYDMATTFETEINMLLHSVTGADVTAGFKTSENDYAEYGDLHDIWGMGVLNTNEKAMKIMKEYGIPSPANCTGAHKDGYGTVEVESGDSSFATTTSGKDNIVESWQNAKEKIKSQGAPEDAIPDFNSIEEIDGQLEDSGENDVYYFYKSKKWTISWEGTAENGEPCTYRTTITIAHYSTKPLYDAHSTEGYTFTSTPITRDFTESEWNTEIENAKKAKEENGEDTSGMTPDQILGTQRCSTTSDEFTEACSNCTNYISKIMSELSTVKDGDFAYYIPYIENVTDHWYRDVYFTNVHYDEDGNATENSLAFVDYDYDYEAVMQERWTEYETYPEGSDRAGEIKLYAVNKSGNYATSESQIENYDSDKFEKEGSYYLFKGSQEEATGSDVVVMKKAKTVKTSDEEILKDLDWSNENSSGIWTAYEDDGELATGWEPTYPDDEDEVKKNIYHKIKSNSNVVQVGEGQRTETNSKIKKMFLQNKYLKYDGTPERAEKITELRKNKSLEYGPVTTTDETVQSYASKVALNQDSLNAFNMLENTHTLDADYIYRDFKELVVELGYFTKEELTDETPRLLQWLVPDIGSGGYPERTIDKNENEFGTMVHSKGDIEANRKNTLKSIIAAAIEESTKDEISDDKKDDNKATKAQEAKTNNKLDIILSELDEDFSGNQFVSLGTANGSEPSGTTTTKSGGGSGSSSLLSLDEWWEETQKIFDIYKSESWVYDDHGGKSSHGCNAGTTFDEVHDGGREKTTDCSIGASWMLQKLGALQEKHTFTSSLGDSGALAESNECAQDLLDAGAEVIVPSAGKQFTAAASGGELEPGDVLFYDGHVSIYCGDSYETGGTTFCWDTGSTTGIQGGGPRDTSWEDRDIKLIIRLPLGTKKTEGATYEGYVGNEAVVSPVTGILLDYGTYTDEDKSSITGEKYRQNVDLKYLKQTDSNQSDPDNQNNNGANNGNAPKENPEYDPEKPDKVGYAKILVLDAENYKKLETGTENPWKSSSLVNMKTKTDEDGDKVTNINYIESSGEWVLDKEDRLSDKDGNKDTEDPWTEIAKTIYGYKEFAERYEMAGISGYVVYIDAFKCEKPDEEFTEEQLESEIPQGDEIKLEDFKKVKSSDLQGTEKPDEENMMPTLYEKDETHKMASKKATEKAQAESEVKNQASSTIYLESEDLIFIKEGTVLGRTITDFELIEGSDYRNEQGGYEKYRGKDETTEPVDPDEPDNNKPDKKDEDENTDAVIGNYLRIILRDTDDTVVENVEDYMKLDEEGDKTKSQECEFEHLAYFLGCLEEGFNASMDQGSSYGVEVLQDGAGNTTAFGLTKSVADTVKDTYPDFGSHLAAGSVPKEEAQDVFILVLEAAKESIQNSLTTPLEEDDSNLFALIDLHHASPSECEQVISEYNAKNNNFSSDELMKLYTEHWGTNENYGMLLRRRGRNRGWLASEGRWFLYQQGSEGDEVIFDSDTPWTEFCDNGGTGEWTSQSCGLYHVEKGADPDYIKS